MDRRRRAGRLQRGCVVRFRPTQGLVREVASASRSPARFSAPGPVGGTAHTDRLIVKPCRHGIGVIARRRIRRGEAVLHFSGPLVRRAELPSTRCAERDLYLQIGDDLFLGPSGNVDDFVNHSCDPNTGVAIAGGRARLIAMRTIRCGEEVVFDYSTTSDGDPLEMRCSCGSPACRGRIGDFLWLPRSLQERYVGLGVVPDYILAKLGEPVA